MPENNGADTEEFQVSGKEILGKLKEIIHQGNVRHIIIKSESGKTLIEVPLTLGILGAALAPPWAVVGAIAALVTKCTILVKTDEDK